MRREPWGREPARGEPQQPKRALRLHGQAAHRRSRLRSARRCYRRPRGERDADSRYLPDQSGPQPRPDHPARRKSRTMPRRTDQRGPEAGTALRQRQPRRRPGRPHQRGLKYRGRRAGTAWALPPPRESHPCTGPPGRNRESAKWTPSAVPRRPPPHARRKRNAEEQKRAGRYPAPRRGQKTGRLPIRSAARQRRQECPQRCVRR